MEKVIILALFSLSYFVHSVPVPEEQSFSFHVLPGIPSQPRSDNHAVSMPFNKFIDQPLNERQDDSINLENNDGFRGVEIDKSESDLIDARSNKPVFFAQQDPPTRHSPKPASSPIINLPSKGNAPNHSKPSNVAFIHFEDTEIPDDYANCSYAFGVTVYNGNCSRLLSSSACAPGYWLILTEQVPPSPYCARRPCRDDLIPYKNQCIDAFNQTACHSGEIIYINYHGQTYCDCETTFVYDSHLKRCLPEHDTGSCPDQYYLEINKQGEVVCSPNPCRHVKYVLHPKSGSCYTKNYTGSCRGNNTQIDYDHTLRIANCQLTSTRNIFEVPAINSCPPGTKRNHHQKCQAIFKLNSRSASSFAVPTRYSTYAHACPYGYSRYPDNSCRKQNPLFGK